MRSQICLFLDGCKCLHHLKRLCGGAVEACLWCEFREGVEATEFIGCVVTETSIYSTQHGEAWFHQFDNICNDAHIMCDRFDFKDCVETHSMGIVF